MDKSVYAAEVDEYTVVGDVLDHAFENLAFLELADELGTLCFLLGLEENLMRDDHVATFLIDLDDLEVDGLIHELIVVADGLDVDLAAGEECLDTEHVHDHTALGAGLDISLDDFVLFECLVDPIPGFKSACLLVREHELALLVFCVLHIDFHLVADFEVGIVAEFRGSDDALALATDGDNNFALVDCRYLSFDNFTLYDLAEGLVVSLADFLLVGSVVDTGSFKGFPVKVFGSDRCVEHPGFFFNFF